MPAAGHSAGLRPGVAVILRCRYIAAVGRRRVGLGKGQVGGALGFISLTAATKAFTNSIAPIRLRV
jgi:hypothetical protein